MYPHRHFIYFSIQFKGRGGGDSCPRKMNSRPHLFYTTTTFHIRLSYSSSKHHASFALVIGKLSPPSVTYLHLSPTLSFPSVLQVEALPIVDGGLKAQKDQTDRKQCQKLLSKKFDLQRDYAAGVCQSEAPSRPRILFGVIKQFCRF